MIPNPRVSFLNPPPTGTQPRADPLGVLGVLRRHTIVGTTIIDYALTIALAIVVTKVTNVPLVLTTSACMMLSVGVHAAFGVDTPTVLWIKDMKS
jgi:hypothetical protein